MVKKNTIQSGFFRIKPEWIGLSQIDSKPIFIVPESKRFSNWFGIVRNQISKWLGIGLIRSDWILIPKFCQESYICTLTNWPVSFLVNVSHRILFRPIPPEYEICFCANPSQWEKRFWILIYKNWLKINPIESGFFRIKPE